jgi:lipoprotein-releasing system permease protein
MYKLLLIFRYLRRKLAPLFAAVAVTLCTAMVIIVISVMGGFLDLLRNSARQLTGDVTISSGSYTGFPYYEELIAELEKLPQVKAATATIQAYGLINLDKSTIPVDIQGVKPQELEQIVEYGSTLHWSTEDYVEYVVGAGGRELDPLEQAYFEEAMDLKQAGMDFVPPVHLQGGPGDRQREGIVLGIEVNPRHRRDAQGQYDIANSAINRRVTLTVLPLTRQGGVLEPAARPMVVVNEFKSGLYEVDANRAYVSFDLLQQMLKMQEVPEADALTGEETGRVIPKRATEISLRGAEGYSLDEVEDAVQSATARFVQAHGDSPMLFVRSWEQVHAQLLNAVANEKGLVTFLFVVISIVAVVMVATTFYMIVLEKTRDIGVLRAIGASRGGIVHLFLGYGLAIGVVGAGAGLVLAVAVVTHLNEIQALLEQWFGWRMWDPQTYFFDRIPDTVKFIEAAAIVVGAILSSVVGALIPALLAGRLNPIEALRYE